MELKVVDKISPSLHRTFGITEERSNEISWALDKITADALEK